MKAENNSKYILAMAKYQNVDGYDMSDSIYPMAYLAESLEDAERMAKDFTRDILAEYYEGWGETPEEDDERVDEEMENIRHNGGTIWSYDNGEDLSIVWRAIEIKA